MSYAKSQIQKARSTDLVTYLQSKGYELKPEGVDGRGQKQYRVPGNGGLFISGNHWYQKSTATGGNTLDFLIKFIGLSFEKSMQELISEDLPTAVQFPPPIRAKKNLQLPNRANNNKRVIAYLTKTRGIPTDTVLLLIREELIYQDDKGNCVFPCLDNDRIAHGAHLRGTLSNVQWRGTAAGSDTSYPWHLPPLKKNSKMVTVCESPIDAISLAALEARCREGHIIALGGAHLEALEAFVNRYDIKSVILGFDHDKGGIELLSRALKLIVSKQILHNWTIMPTGKDWNEDLIKKNN